MNLDEAITTVSEGYDTIEAEDRITIVHFLRYDYGTWDMSPPLSFPCGQRPSDLAEGLALIGRRDEIGGIITAVDSWGYPEHINKQTSDRTEEERQEFWRKTPPMTHPEHVNLGMVMAVTKRGDMAIGMKTREPGSKLTLAHSNDEDVKSFGGVQVRALRFILGLSE